MALWTSDLEGMIFTIIKAKFPEHLKTKYPDIFFTNSNITESDPKFPAIYFHEMSGVEQGNDIENTTVNAVLASYQVDVFSNISQSDAKEVMYAVCEIMKGLRFSIINMPEFQNTDVYRSTATFRRMIGANDIL